MNFFRFRTCWVAKGHIERRPGEAFWHCFFVPTVTPAVTRSPRGQIRGAGLMMKGTRNPTLAGSSGYEEAAIISSQPHRYDQEG